VPPERVTVIPNPAPPVDTSEPREELRRRLGLSGPTFVFAGRFVRQKNLPLAIEALRLVDGASLVLVGEGPEADVVAEAIARNGLGNRVSVRAAVARDVAVDWVRAADAALLSSDWENFPHAAVEALAAGTPVVATSVGGVPEIIEHDANGLLVPPGDAGALAAVMRSVTEDHELVRRLRAGAAGSSGRYSAAKTFAAIERELQQAVVGR
jgi:glycosyltransferase involved in cell wall biosynthesis